MDTTTNQVISRSLVCVWVTGIAFPPNWTTLPHGQHMYTWSPASWKSGQHSTTRLCHTLDNHPDNHPLAGQKHIKLPALTSVGILGNDYYWIDGKGSIVVACVCVCVSVCVCVNPGLVCMITCGVFNLALQNLDQKCKTPCLSGTFSLECVSKIKSILSIIFHAIYGLCVFSFLFNFSCDDCENTCSLSYYMYHHQIGSMTHLPLFRVRSWNNGMRCMSFYILLVNDPYCFFGVNLSFKVELNSKVKIYTIMSLSTW